MPHAVVHQQASLYCSGKNLFASAGNTRVTARCVKRRCATIATANPSFGDNIKRVAKQVQGALPLVGLLSRLTSPSGGVGRDMLAYPEFCRATFDLAPANFLTICSELQKQYGKAPQALNSKFLFLRQWKAMLLYNTYCTLTGKNLPADRRYVLLYIWMAREGGGVVPSKPIMSSAKRLRVTQDMEIEIDRFEGARSEIAKKYSYMDRPVGKPREQINIAVDALSRLVTGTPDTEAIPEPAASLFEELVKGAWADIPDVEQLAKQAIATRPERTDNYK